MIVCTLISGSWFPGRLEKLVLQTSWTSISGESRMIWVTLGAFWGQEMGNHSPKLPGKELVGKVPSYMATHLHNFIYRMPAATAVVDAGARPDQMKDFDWANAKMTMEYIFTSKASIIKVV